MNPRPTFFSTGIYSTRAQLRNAVRTLRRHNMNWTAIGKAVGVSDRTAKRCFEEDERIRKEARAVAYKSATPVAAAQRSTLPRAAVVYGLLVALILLVGAVIAFTR